MQGDGAGAGDYCGSSVSINSDGSSFAIAMKGGYAVTGTSVRAYDWNGSSWSQKGLDINGEIGDSSHIVSISADGNTIAIGSPQVQLPGDTGHVKVYQYPSSAGVNLNTLKDIEVYPNPTSGSTSINGLNTLNKISFVRLIDNKGNLIRKIDINEKNIDLTSQSNGIYFIEIKHQHGTERIKIVKQ